MTTIEWDPNIDGVALIAFNANQITEEQYNAVRTRSAGVHFYRGDKLRAISVLDEDGEPCEGRLVLDEIVTMTDRSSEYRPFIIIERENGKQLQLEKTRFILESRSTKKLLHQKV